MSKIDFDKIIDRFNPTIQSYTDMYSRAVVEEMLRMACNQVLDEADRRCMIIDDYRDDFEDGYNTATRDAKRSILQIKEEL